MKKKILILGIFAVQVFLLVAQNSANRILTEERNVGYFDKIDIRGRFDVKIAQQEKNSLSVSAQEKFLDYIETSVKNGTLVVKIKEPDEKKGFFDKLKEKYPDFTTRQKIEVNIGVKNLQNIQMGGASSLITLNKLSLSDIDINISGASKAILELESDIANIEVSGTSSIQVTGNANQSTVKVSGASSCKGAEFHLKTAVINVSGASSASVFTTENFTGNASGASSIQCFGNPKSAQRDVSGASKIEMKRGNSTVQ